MQHPRLITADRLSTYAELACFSGPYSCCVSQQACNAIHGCEEEHAHAAKCISNTVNDLQLCGAFGEKGCKLRARNKETCCRGLSAGNYWAALSFLLI